MTPVSCRHSQRDAELSRLDVFADAAGSCGVRARRFGTCLHPFFNGQLGLTVVISSQDLCYGLDGLLFVQEMLETNSVPEAHAGGKEPHNIRHEDGSDGAWKTMPDYQV
jgi:hypothetical protein